MNKFRWRDITDGGLSSYNQRKIFVKGLNKNKIYVTTVKDFFYNKDNKYDYCWLPIYEKKYLFLNLEKSIFCNDHKSLSRRNRCYSMNDKELFNIINYDKVKEIIDNRID